MKYGGTLMTTPSTLVSLRITDEENALLDSRIGLDGARNRSDVIRARVVARRFPDLGRPKRWSNG